MKTLVSFIDTAQNIAIIASKIDDIDKVYSLIALNRHLTSLGKTVSNILINVDEIWAAELNKVGIDYKKAVSAPDYIISIDYGSTGVDKVVYNTDESTGKLSFHITPSKGTFDFSKVEYKVQGDALDKIILLGVNSYDELGDSYSSNKSLFAPEKIFNISPDNKIDIKNFVKFHPEQSYSSALLMFLKEEAKGEVLEILQNGVVASLNITEGESSSARWKDIVSLTGSNANLTNLIQTKYFSKSYENFALQMRLIHNMSFDRERSLIWSLINKEEIVSVSIKPEDIDFTGRILFNISSEFRFTFAAYEIKEGVFTVVIESNNIENFSAAIIAEAFGGKGNEYHAQFELPAENKGFVESKVLEMINSIYPVKVTNKQEVGGIDDIEMPESEDLDVQPASSSK